MLKSLLPLALLTAGCIQKPVLPSELITIAISPTNNAFIDVVNNSTSAITYTSSYEVVGTNTHWTINIYETNHLSNLKKENALERIRVEKYFQWMTYTNPQPTNP